ncbi:hypothetical protein E2C01_002838 [Portunus trituberculatus]|uniref:Uncharacterized protein n=1 Tax=Portunus trituberculatus TaxID=210409 RepID=A0A5B7CKT5_PORTR|nr:hypothetical protein [Portunus trituberculatus]
MVCVRPGQCHAPGNYPNLVPSPPPPQTTPVTTQRNTDSNLHDGYSWQCHPSRQHTLDECKCPAGYTPTRPSWLCVSPSESTLMPPFTCDSTARHHHHTPDPLYLTLRLPLVERSLALSSTAQTHDLLLLDRELVVVRDLLSTRYRLLGLKTITSCCILIIVLTSPLLHPPHHFKTSKFSTKCPPHFITVSTLSWLNLSKSESVSLPKAVRSRLWKDRTSLLTAIWVSLALLDSSTARLCCCGSSAALAAWSWWNVN